jgi:hypothetical protein
VEDCHHDDALNLHTVIDAVRIPTDNRFAQVLEDNRIRFGSTGDSIQNLTDGGSKLLAEPGSAALIPFRSLVELDPSCAPEENGESHFRNRANASASICSQGTTSSGLAW